MSTIKNDVNNLKDEALDRAKAAQSAGVLNPIEALHRAGVKSEWAYLGGFVSIVISLGTWLASRANKNDDKAQSDRWGIFVGHWAPTFFAIGLALKHEER
ncbi:MAG: hypothetical protein ABIO06_10815 [Pseudolysinimonas sp.]